MRLEGKTALITGGAGVIGLAAARRFLAEGARGISLVDVDRGRLDEAVAELDAGDRVIGVTADVTDPESVRAYAEATAAAFGKVDVFLNNAGIEGGFAPVTDFPDEMFTKVMEVNVTGVYLGAKYVLPTMNDGGSIVITSSVAGLAGSPNMIAYVTSKHAVIGTMRTLAVECAARGIRVNTIHPGMVKSEMMDRLVGLMGGDGIDPQAVADLLNTNVPFGRFVTPEEVVDGMVYLASDDSRMVTGTQLVVDGGLTVA